MGSESIAHEAEGRMGYRLRGHEARGIIVLAKSNWFVKNIENKKKMRYLKLDFNSVLPPKSRRFSLLVGYNKRG